jgi:rhodanese-related sulfurtransferase
MLMRLSRKDFDMMLVGQRVQWVDFGEVKQKVADGAQLLDTRFESEFKSGTLRGALNIPFYVLRLRMSQLNADQPYIVFCNDARQSAAAAFLMRQEGLDVSVIRDGIQGRQN